MKFKSILPALIVAFSTTFMVVSCANDDTDNMTDPGQQDVSFSELPVNARNLIQDKYNETDIDEILR